MQQPGAPEGSRLHLTRLLVVAIVIVLLDQATKFIAVAELGSGRSVELVPGILTLRLVRNPGAAFGLASGATVIFPVIAAVVVVVILRMGRRLGSAAWALALGLLLGGAVGNLIDRLLRPPGVLRGHVIDFLELPRWPVFNVADMSIVSAAALLAVLSIRGYRPDGTREGVPDPSLDSSAGRSGQD